MPEWKLNRFRGAFCIVWNEGDTRRRYSLGTSDREEATRLAPARFAELTRPSGTTIEDLWSGYIDDRQDRPVTGTMKHTWKALAKRFGRLDASQLTTARKLLEDPMFSPHMLRHSSAVWVAEDGHSMWEVSQFLGHNDVKTTTRIYARFSPTHLRKLADTLAI